MIINQKRVNNFIKFLCNHLYLSVILLLLIGATCFFSIKPNITSVTTLMKWTGFGGYCTDWVYARWKQVHPSEELKVNGNAWEWYGYARDHGMPTGTNPRVGSVVVWNPYVGGAGDVGHVAFVERVYSSNTFRVSEMDWSCGRGCSNNRNINMASGIHFIYSQQQIVQCNEYDRCKGVGPDVYFIERGKKRLVPNPDTRDYLNNRYGGDVKTVSDDQLNKYPNGRNVPSITWSNTHDYVLIKTISSEWTYVMSSGVKRYLFSYDQKDPGDGDFYYPSDVRTISEGEFINIPYGPALYLNDHLVRGSSSLAVYLMDRNKKRLVPNLETLQSRGFKPENIYNIPQEAVDEMATGRNVPSSTWLNTHDDVLIKNSSNNWTYVMKNGKRKYLFNYDQINPDDGDFFYPSDVRILSDTEISEISLGVPLSWRNQMIRATGSMEVYVIERDKKRYLPDIDTLLYRDLKPENIVDIPKEIVNMFPTGRSVPNVNWSNMHDNVLLQEIGSDETWLMRDGTRNKLRSFDDIDPIDGDWYYESDIRQVTTLQDIPIQPLNLPLSLSMAKIYWASIKDYNNRELSVDYVIRNNNDNDAYNVTLTNSDNNKNVITLTELPVNLGDISAEEQGTITVKYYIPIGTIRFHADITATAEDFNKYLHIYPEIQG